jgi:pyruvate-formate lyase-activating enzyme
MNLDQLPYMLMADGDGQVFEHPHLRMVGASGREHRPPARDELIPMPYGSDLHILPGRHPVGIDPDTGAIETVSTYQGEPVFAVSAFLAPAHTVLLWSAFDKEPGAPVLPLYAYAAAGWMGDGFVAAGLRIDPDIRQDLDNFPAGGEEDDAARLRADSYPDNRLIGHLAHCCTVYRCPAARNLFLNRYEAPLPTSTGCNARCIGCISLQENASVPCTQDRIDFVPTPEEVAQIAVEHIERASEAVVSFGQGCEGEPLTNWKLLQRSIVLIRQSTDRGTINLNTNASNPDALESLFAAGLDSIRVSMNSARPQLYEAYFRPMGYGFEDVVRSMEVARDRDRFVSVNYFVFPGVTDETKEMEAMARLMERTNFSMIQWRNLNIDPDLYLECMEGAGLDTNSSGVGVQVAMEELKKRFPKLRFGYFNPAIR